MISKKKFNEGHYVPAARAHYKLNNRFFYILFVFIIDYYAHVMKLFIEYYA
jgi:hypothetical protein